MDLLTVNQEKCLRCGICVECCPSCILSMGENGPECNFDRGCMSCGQCVGGILFGVVGGIVTTAGWGASAGLLSGAGAVMFLGALALMFILRSRERKRSANE